MTRNLVFWLPRDWNAAKPAVYLAALCFGVFGWCVAALCSSYRDVAVNNEQLLSGHVKLAAQLIRLPVDDSEALVVRVENGLQKLQLGLQSRYRHLPLLISGHREGEKRKQRER